MDFWRKFMAMNPVQLLMKRCDFLQTVKNAGAIN